MKSLFVRRLVQTALAFILGCVIASPAFAADPVFCRKAADSWAVLETTTDTVAMRTFAKTVPNACLAVRGRITERLAALGSVSGATPATATPPKAFRPQGYFSISLGLDWTRNNVEILFRPLPGAKFGDASIRSIKSQVASDPQHLAYIMITYPSSEPPESSRPVVAEVRALLLDLGVAPGKIRTKGYDTGGTYGIEFGYVPTCANTALFFSPGDRASIRKPYGLTGCRD
jgi:hypothetical protein